jgi:hypothetical protein
MTNRPTRRETLQRLAYVAPAILTLAVAPSFAKEASGPPVRPKRRRPVAQ